MNAVSSLRAALLLLAFAVATSCSTPPEPPSGAARVFIVRHAEKLAGDDPGLTVQGLRRAGHLADRLENEGIVRIFSTDTQRTLATAAPLARRLGLAARLYRADAQAGLAAEIAASGETVLIVGHSNTIAVLVAAFGGEPGEAVADDEYDRLYEVTLEADGARVETHRYGD